MREIKFRMFRKTEGLQEMIYLHAFVPYGEGWFGGDPKYKFYELYFGRNGMMKVHAEDIELMQYTGLKDKNGKEIYEGDVVRIPNLYPSDPIDLYTYTLCSVTFTNGWFQLDDKEPVFDFVVDEEIEVIGNIYENAELIAQ